ncbi:hypothetical protein [Chitinolyticbacter meiyuanensis]|uniref:hypothetical protein n=1 Tax=Chitinolyticbacter meiyuanensis TaxID=682798 RepID=UPI0011E5EE2A|nr:hypothetical protein [Chitinolyticbacter meiyuanensis]
MLDLATIKKHFISFIFALSLLGGWSAYNLNGTISLKDKEAEFNKKQTNDLNKFIEKIRKEEAQLRTNELALEKLKLELSTKLEKLEAREKSLQEVETLLAEKASTMGKREEQISGLATALMPLQQEKQTDGEIRALMNQFAETGVNLSDTPECDDKQGWLRYNQALAIHKQISTLAKSSRNLASKYDYFLSSTARWSFGPGCKVASPR